MIENKKERDEKEDEERREKIKTDRKGERK